MNKVNPTTSVHSNFELKCKSYLGGSYLKIIHILVFSISFLFFGAFAVFLGQDNNWDLRNYHFYNPYAFIEGRLGFDYAPAQHQSYYNPAADLPFYFLVTHLKPRLVGFIIGAFQGLNCGLIFAIAFQVLSYIHSKLRLEISLLFAAIGMYSPVFIAEYGTTQNDTFTALFVLASVLILTRTLAFRDTLALPHGRNALIIGGLLLGFGVGLKLTVLTYAIGATLAILSIEGRWIQSTRIMGVWCLSGLTGLLMSSGHWMATMWLKFGNPIFPFYNTVFKSPYFDPVDFTSPAGFLPTTLWDGLTYPFHFVTETLITQKNNEFQDARYAIIYILIIVYIVYIYYRNVNKHKLSKKELKKQPTITVVERFLLVFFISSYILWQLKFSIIRYVPPLEAIGALIIFILIRNIFRDFKIQTILTGAALVAIVVVCEPPKHQRLPWASTFFQVTPPQLKEPDNTIVVIASRRPWAYLIPFFDPGIQFVRIGGNFTSPSRPNLMKSEMRDLLHKHTGPIYLLSRREFLRVDIGILNYYQLAITEAECDKVISKHERPGLCLWPIAVRGR